MTRDQFLCELMGVPYINWVCDEATDFDKPDQAYRLMQFVMGAEWWREFSEAMFHKFCHDFNTTEWNQMGFIKWLFSDPDRFAGLVAEYRGWKGW